MSRYARGPLAHLIGAALVIAAPVAVSTAHGDPHSAPTHDAVSPRGSGPTSAAVGGALSAVSADSATDAWAVGDGLIEHWNGSTWRPVAHPAGSLSSVVTVSPTDAWAVGGGVATLIEHWDGSAWSTVSSPSFGPAGVLRSFSAVAASGPDDVWAVGTEVEVNPEDTAPISAHWDGTAWTAVQVPNHLSRFGRYGAALAGVKAVSPTDAWAVGGWGKRQSGKTYVVHWDGTAWKQQKSQDPNGRDGQALQAVDATSATDIWAVGHLGQALSKHDPLVERSDGVNWSVGRSPAGKSVHALTGVSMTSPTDGWALTDSSGVEHWNGGRWKAVTTPNAGRFARLYAIDALSATDAWVVGAKEGDALVEHWDGSAWTIVQK